MVLQATRAQKLGLRPDYGIDYQLLMAARESNIAVMELEGADSQIALLRDLPDGGMALLEDTLTHWRTNARLLQVAIGWWLEQPPSRGAVSLPTTFSQSLYDVLMHQRNLAARDAAGLAAGALRGRRRRAASVWRRESAGYADIKKWPILLLARQRGISSLLLSRDLYPGSSDCRSK